MRCMDDVPAPDAIPPLPGSLPPPPDTPSRVPPMPPLDDEQDVMPPALRLPGRPGAPERVGSRLAGGPFSRA